MSNGLRLCDEDCLSNCVLTFKLNNTNVSGNGNKTFCTQLRITDAVNINIIMWHITTRLFEMHLFHPWYPCVCLLYWRDTLFKSTRAAWIANLLFTMLECQAAPQGRKLLDIALYNRMCVGREDLHGAERSSHSLVVKKRVASAHINRKRLNKIIYKTKNTTTCCSSFIICFCIFCASEKVLAL